MAIKKIIFKGLETTGSYVSLAQVKFYDLEGNLIEIGEKDMQLSTEKLRTGNCILSSEPITGGSTDKLYVTFTSDTTSYGEVIRINKTAGPVDITCEFINPVEFISRIEYNTRATGISSVYAVTEPFKIVAVSDKGSELEFDRIPTTVSEKVLFSDQSLIGQFPTHSPQFVITKDESRIDNIEIVEGIIVNQYEPANTKIRYAFSFNNRETWASFNGESWIEVNADPSEILQNGMDKDTMEALTAHDFANIKADERFLTVFPFNVDVYCALVTEDSFISPIIKSVTFKYKKIMSKKGEIINVYQKN